MSWKNCDSHSTIECLSRGCQYAKILYYIDQSYPEIECTKPNNEWIKD